MTTMRQISIMQPGQDHGGAGTFPRGSTSHRKYMWEQGKKCKGKERLRGVAMG